MMAVERGNRRRSYFSAYEQDDLWSVAACASDAAQVPEREEVIRTCVESANGVGNEGVAVSRARGLDSLQRVGNAELSQHNPYHIMPCRLDSVDIDQEGRSPVETAPVNTSVNVIRATPRGERAAQEAADGSKIDRTLRRISQPSTHRRRRRSRVHSHISDRGYDTSRRRGNRLGKLLGRLIPCKPCAV
eukprot:scpid78756/ scgid31632/ 